MSEWSVDVLRSLTLAATMKERWAVLSVSLHDDRPGARLSMAGATGRFELVGAVRFHVSIET